MTRTRITSLSLPIALAALLLLPAASSYARPLGIHLPTAVCHQYCDGADHQLAAADQGPAEHVHTIVVRAGSAFHRQDAAIGAAAGGGAVLIALAVVSRTRRAH